MDRITVLDAQETRAALGLPGAVAAIEAALRAGLDPAGDLPRSTAPVRAGEFVMMPSEVADAAGMKILTVAPGNPGRGLPRIQGLYIVVESRTLTPIAILDGAALTAMRTAAVTVAALRPALERASPMRLVLVGAGPQARSHASAIVETLDGVRPIEDVAFVARTSRPALSKASSEVLAIGSSAAQRVLRAADVVICATTARGPLFDSAMLRSDAVVAAVGSHLPDVSELDAALLGRAQVVVEDRANALRESGEVVMAIAEGALRADDLVPMAEVVRGTTLLGVDRPVVFTSAGMPWQDLVVARAVLDAAGITDAQTR